MIWISVIVCLVLVGLMAIWFSPLRQYLLELTSGRYAHLFRIVRLIDRSRFSCFVERFSDETQPAMQDQFFQVQIAGRIPTQQDNVDTHVKVEISDITEGKSDPHPVFSIDERYRDEENAEFCLIQHNGIVPEKNAILARLVTVAKFPCHILKFAYRGRRKLLFRTTVLETESQTEIVSSQQIIEHVYCSDGYREVHGRRLEVLQSCVELSAVVLGPGAYSDTVRQMWSNFIQQKSEMLISEEEAVKTVEAVQNRSENIAIQHCSHIVLAYGKNTDRFCAIELALQTAASNNVVGKENLEKLFQIAHALEIQQDRFLGMAQKLLLSSNCKIEDPSQLLGITSDMAGESFRKRLNEEYRKWNARVTHPDPQVRSQADQILTLIAEIRSQWLQVNS